MDRKIIHLDMDCFYAAIEVRDHPELAGKPVGVGGARHRRGVLTTCNYEARKYGVRSAMPTFEALQKCPHLIVMPTRFDVYRRESARIRNILYKFTSIVEPLSLDEAFLDLSAQEGEPVAVAKVIREMIRQQTGLTASAGIAPNKMLAKIASDWRKPNGQFEIKPEDVPAFMENLPVHRLWGIGQKTAKRLAGSGIQTCRQLQAYPRLQLYSWFGKFGLELFQLCRGIDERPVEPDRHRKSLSNERTFVHNLTSPAQCEGKLPELFEDLMQDLAKHDGKTKVRGVMVKIRFADFTRTTVERADLPLALESFRLLLHEGLQRKTLPVRLLGVGVRLDEPDESTDTQLEFDLA
ncbi:MAG: DNA polymerase IV [Verrucomicrobia bacterium]|nr:DNA polymerase IV [Verrucomicrobiota bacterium]